MIAKASKNSFLDYKSAALTQDSGDWRRAESPVIGFSRSDIFELIVDLKNS
jgi:hypothetical protein